MRSGRAARIGVRTGTGAAPGVSPRARRRGDRAGDPLAGLVNLFDLGIVLSVAFLIAALSSLDLSPQALREGREPPGQEPRRAPADSVVADPDAVKPIELRPGERVVGRGERVGTVYRLRDGRTVIVRQKDGGAE